MARRPAARQVPAALGLPPARARIIQVDKDQLTLWRDLLDRRDEPLDETPLVHTVTTAELRSMAKLAGNKPAR